VQSNCWMPNWLTKALQACTDADSNTPGCLTGSDAAPFLRDWRGRYTSKALAVLMPRNTAELSTLVAACHQNNIKMVPQGGNTGLVGGAVADLQSDGLDTVVINLSKLRGTAQVDPLNRTLTVSAGYTLQEVQDMAQAAGLLFPLSLASEGSCTIGGNLATNAGGTAVLRYGNTRDLVLGLDAVLPNGDCLCQNTGLRKNNTGYALKDLMIASEGTLGIISEVTLKLFSQPKQRLTAWISLESAAHALRNLNSLLDEFDAALTSFEWMQHHAVALVAQHFHVKLPTAQQHSYALIELCSASRTDTLTAQFEAWAEAATTQGLFQDCVLAQSEQQAKQLWALRENISEAQAKEGLNVKHDIALPVSAIPEFLKSNLDAVNAINPGIRPVVFGHLGDGNLHYNFSAPAGQDAKAFLAAFEHTLNAAVYADVNRFNGSISAEHGIGLLKKEVLLAHQDPVALATMRSIKKALDPLNLMNPGKLLG